MPTPPSNSFSSAAGVAPAKQDRAPSRKSKSNSDAQTIADRTSPLLSVIFTADLCGVITGCSGQEQFGFPPADLVGRKIQELFCADAHAGLGDSELASTLEHGCFEGSFTLRNKSADAFTDQLRLQLLCDASGSPASIVGFFAQHEGPADKESNQIPASADPHKNSSVPLMRREIDGTEFLIASPIMHKFMGMVDRVAGHTETVLVTGETGTGKELVARTIHDSSYRRSKALVDINCAALPEHLVESELFGYEKGAFSGADASKAGLFELADKSTIFLDEIGELQPQVQVKLLRVLDGAPYYRLGGHRKITVDVRVVAATNQDLELAVKEGRFRQDLFHRLSQFQLRVPPLRERPEDVLALARHFLLLKDCEKSFSRDALSALQAHAWTGNIRELRNLVAKLAMAVENPQISGADVMNALTGEYKISSQSVGAPVPLGNLENMEEQMIIRALELTGGHRTQAAERLGISRRTLTRKLREYGIDVPSSDAPPKLGVISEDQQKFFRAKVNLSVTLRNHQGKELQVQAANLSTGGMGLDSVADPVGFAGLVDVSFLLPDSEVEIHAKGRLVWADAGGRAGLRFVVIEPALFEKLQHWTNRKMKDEGWEIPS
jgi:DNA-binding NtrC family response regulator